MNSPDPKRHERRKARQAAAAAGTYPLPSVFYPACWPVDATEKTVVAWTLQMIEEHHPYNAAVAELARRRGGGGYLHVVVQAGGHTLEHNGRKVVCAHCTARWHAGQLLPDGESLRPEHARGPSQTAFTVHVQIDAGEGRRCSCTALVEGAELHARYLRQLESSGWNPQCVAIAALDGGAMNGGVVGEVAR